MEVIDLGIVCGSREYTDHRAEWGAKFYHRRFIDGLRNKLLSINFSSDERSILRFEHGIGQVGKNNGLNWFDLLEWYFLVSKEENHSRPPKGFSSWHSYYGSSPRRWYVRVDRYIVEAKITTFPSCREEGITSAFQEYFEAMGFKVLILNEEDK